jgi:hypothetical protein
MRKLRQLTFGPYGHTLNRRQVLSPDGQWVVYDTRNDDSQIASTNAIEMVHIESGEIVSLYRVPASSSYGPGVGAAAFHPTEFRAVFIHGLMNCSEAQPYSAARRFGAIVDCHSISPLQHAESRSAPIDGDSESRAWGVLSGGTHAHSWNPRGWISYTYNDAWLERYSKTTAEVRDARTIGFMLPRKEFIRPSSVADGDGEVFEGTYAAFLAADVKRTAAHDTDEIEQALEECWLGSRNALAFQGGVRDRQGELRSEVYVSELPGETSLENLTQCSRNLSSESRLQITPGCNQRRLTYTMDRKYPGIQGPRHWLVSSVDGTYCYCLMRDEAGVVQLHRVSTQSGAVEQVSALEFSIEGQITLNPAGTQCAFLCHQRPCLLTLDSGRHEWLATVGDRNLVGAVHFAGAGRWICNAYVGKEPHRYLQIFVGGE